MALAPFLSYSSIFLDLLLPDDLLVDGAVSTRTLFEADLAVKIL